MQITEKGIRPKYVWKNDFFNIYSARHGLYEDWNRITSWSSNKRIRKLRSSLYKFVITFTRSRTDLHYVSPTRDLAELGQHFPYKHFISKWKIKIKFQNFVIASFQITMNNYHYTIVIYSLAYSRTTSYCHEDVVLVKVLFLYFYTCSECI